LDELIAKATGQERTAVCCFTLLKINIEGYLGRGWKFVEMPTPIKIKRGGFWWWSPLLQLKF
jgi:hypothetical protein